MGRLGFAAWCAGLAATLWFLHRVGSGDLATPPPPWAWHGWLQQVDPASAVVALLRVIALFGAWYLAVVSVAGAVGVRSGIPHSHAVVNRATPPFLRSLLHSAGGLTLSAAGLTLAVTPLLTQGDNPTMAPARADDVFVPVRPNISVGTLIELEGEPSIPSIATLRPFKFNLGPFARPVTDVQETADQHWTVQTGDHFWHIAEETLAEAWARQPTEPEVTAYWATLVQANRDQLVVPANPDLIYPGQTFVLPSVRGEGPSR